MVEMPTAVIKRTALMICTQVVPFIPPIITYRIITTPTTAMTTDWPTRPSMPISSETRAPAPAIWARR